MGTLLALGLGLAQTANAADCLALSVQLTAYQQDRDEEKVSASLILSTVKKVKITTQDLLNLLAQYHGLTFPSGTQICLDATDETKIRDKVGHLLLTPSTTVFLVGGSNTVNIANINLAAGNVTTKHWSVGGGEFHWAPNLNFALSGLMLAQASWKHPSERVKMSATTNWSGVGEYGGEFAVFSGKMSFRGEVAAKE